jgi:hypothetical protein
MIADPNQATNAQEQDDLDKRFQERFALLPRPLQQAIQSVDVEKKLRDLADKHKIHLDQWELLETEVRLALYGFQPAEDLEKNIQNEVGISAETAAALTSDISRVIFEPIREELERGLAHPEAKEREVSDVEAARAQMLSGGTRAGAAATSAAPSSVRPAVQPPPAQPATPPAPGPAQKAVRGPTSGAYAAGSSSSARKDIHDDPYRETPGK